MKNNFEIKTVDWTKGIAIPRYKNKVVSTEYKNDQGFHKVLTIYYNDKGISYKDNDSDHTTEYLLDSNNEIIKTYIDGKLFDDINRTNRGYFNKQHKLKCGYDEFIEYVDYKGRLIYEKYGSLCRSIVYDEFDRVVSIYTNYYDEDEMKLNCIVVNYRDTETDDIDSYIIDGLLYLNNNDTLTNGMTEIGTDQKIVDLAKMCYMDVLDSIEKYKNDKLSKVLYLNGTPIETFENTECNIYVNDELIYDVGVNDTRVYLTVDKNGDVVSMQSYINDKCDMEYKTISIQDNEDVTPKRRKLFKNK
ncbi:MAG: hypothetical protein KZY55_13865 [Paeniclostridium sp.]|nr:hypothetical protein [Paeniclostridium sp.]MBW4875139.1 hypothetical protein [Paeniclostridium sp.]